MIHKVTVTPTENPRGIFGDLNQKLLDDIQLVITRYVKLCFEMDHITSENIISGMLSTLSVTMIKIEIETKLSSQTCEKFLSYTRGRMYNEHAKRGDI